MTKDKWHRLIEDEMRDIPGCVDRLKGAYWRKARILIVAVVVGSVMMSMARFPGTAAVGCFVAVSGMAAMLALSTMCHAQLCLYRIVMEVRKRGWGDGERRD